MANKVIGKIPYSLSLRLVNPGDAESAKKIAPTLQSVETITLRMMANHMAEHTSAFSAGEILGILTDMVSCTIEYLRAGYSVNFEGLAKFHLTCSADLSDNVQEFTTASIKKVNVRATIDKEAQAQFTPSNLDFEYAMTREEQAAAKKAAKETLPQAPEDEGDDEGGGSGSGSSDDPDPGVTE